jgi:hypothetical protein
MAEIKKQYGLIDYKQLIHEQVAVINAMSRQNMKDYFDSIEHLELLLTPKLDDTYKSAIKRHQGYRNESILKCNKEQGRLLRIEDEFYSNKFKHLVSLLDRLGWLG